MKIKFDANLDYQADAISSIVGIFEGQRATLDNLNRSTRHGLGIGNKLSISKDAILSNIQGIQRRQNLSVSTEVDALDFTVEMETGTGKTYVYLRSIFELNQKYGFTKFIIVVPSIAIKEGTHKSLQITRDHFRGLYRNIRYSHFIYNAQKLGQVRSFSDSDSIEIMVINIDAFRKSFIDPNKPSKANIIHRTHDAMMGFAPIQFIQDTNPIVIIDEPQSVFGKNSKKAVEAVASLNPLCTLQFSATLREKHHQIFRLDSVDAYERKLVKQVEVAGITISESHNRAYVRLLKVNNKSGFSARIELDVISKGKVRREKKTVKPHSSLFDLSGGRPIYEGYKIDDINCYPGAEHISFTGVAEVVYLGQSIGEIDHTLYKRLQIRKTIIEHLRKELRLNPIGIKVLSLFFLDRVANYRSYNAEGKPVMGKWATIFEEEYMQAISSSEFEGMHGSEDPSEAAQGSHDGYFAIDKKKDCTGRARLKESKTSGRTAADGDAYQLIMRDKEKLLSLSSKLRFIFSHSALREGWDNPNVFQICTLNETTSTIKKRQEIGRGLRICVNQEGERVYGFDVNTLTVITNESYQDFANALQKEIEKDTGIKFGMIEKDSFAGLPFGVGYQGEKFGIKRSALLWEHLNQAGYITANGTITETLRGALRIDDISLPHHFRSQHVIDHLWRVTGGLNMRNAQAPGHALIKKIPLDREFKTLWDEVHSTSTFRVSFDCQRLISDCAKKIRDSTEAKEVFLTVQKGMIHMNHAGVSAERSEDAVSQRLKRKGSLPDIISDLEERTGLMRRSIVQILLDSETINQFTVDPHEYMDRCCEIINSQLQSLVKSGVRYTRLNNDAIYAQERISTPRPAMAHMTAVKRWRLPRWFSVSTPLGKCHPRHALLAEDESHSYLYLSHLALK